MDEADEKKVALVIVTKTLTSQMNFEKVHKEYVSVPSPQDSS